MVRRFLTLPALFVAASAVSNAATLVSNRSIEAATVAAVQPTRVADVVLLASGFESGLRQGMVLSVARGGLEIAEIVLVELRARASAALIMQLTQDQSIQAGDIATVKTLKI